MFSLRVFGYSIAINFDLNMYVMDWVFDVNGTTSVPKSVLRYSEDKVRQESKSEVWYSTASYVQKLKSPIKVFHMS